jgi:putative DNA primase/helicase
MSEQQFLDLIPEAIAPELTPPGGLGWVVAALARTEGKVKPTKLPFNPRDGKPARHNDPSTGTDFQTALAALRSNLELHPPADSVLLGPRTLGRILFRPYWGKDYDHCVINGAIDPEVEEDLKRLDTYAEFSWSGTGIHVIGHGEAPERGHKKDEREIYGFNRFFVFTGHVVSR